MKTNKASLLRRIVAFLIDFVIITLIIVLFTNLLTQNNNIEVLNKEFNNTVNNMGNVSFSVSFNQLALIYKDLDMEKIMYSVINALMIFIYFIFIPYFFDGKTIGKKILKIKTVRNDKECLSLKNLVIKNMVDTGLMYILFSLTLIYILPATSYFIFVIVLSILQISLIVASIFMIIKRKDKRGLNDILSGTKVINDNTFELNNNIENDIGVK